MNRLNLKNETELQAFRELGDSKVKKWHERPHAQGLSEHHVLTYCVENGQRTLGVSVHHRGQFDINAFLAIHPLIEKIFGKPFEFRESVQGQRGFTWLVLFNDWRTAPFITKDCQ